MNFVKHGALFLARPVSERGQAWLDEYCPEGDDHTYWGEAPIVERPYAIDLAQVAVREGLEV